MKYITFTVPCYNSAAYMERCVDSLLIGGEDVEILLIDDGSTDRTGEIADEYERNYPGIVRAVHKANGGHGSGVNAGLHLATGCYFKVVDSDDWLSEDAYRRLGTAHTMAYRNVFPAETPCTWNDIGHFRPSQYLIMHALIYRTSVLRETGVCLPEHTFYVDNIFAYQPLPYVKKIYYMDIDLYQYFLGRADQSVNEEVMMRRIDQQIKVTKIVASCVDLDEMRQKYPKLAVYMCRNISIMMAISSIHLLLINDRAALEWNTIREEDKMLYLRLKYTTLSGFTYLPGKVGGKITVQGYRIARKLYQFQ